MNSTPVSQRICACGRYFYIQKKESGRTFYKKADSHPAKARFASIFSSKKIIYRVLCRMLYYNCKQKAV